MEHRPASGVEGRAAAAVRYAQLLELKESRPSQILPAAVSGGILGFLIIAFLMSGPT